MISHTSAKVPPVPQSPSKWRPDRGQIISAFFQFNPRFDLHFRIQGFSFRPVRHAIGRIDQASGCVEERERPAGTPKVFCSLSMNSGMVWLATSFAKSPCISREMAEERNVAGFPASSIRLAKAGRRSLACASSFPPRKDSDCGGKPSPESEATKAKSPNTDHQRSRIRAVGWRESALPMPPHWPCLARQKSRKTMTRSDSFEDNCLPLATSKCEKCRLCIRGPRHCPY